MGATTAVPVEESTTVSSEEPHSEPESEPETEPEAEAEHEGSDGSSSVVGQCGSCRGCKTSDGGCCMDSSKSYCESFSDNTWCGAAPRALLQRKKQQFLGLGLIQDGALKARGLVSDEL